MQGKKQDCNVADPGGECWQLPATCPIVVVGGRARPCLGASIACSDECQAIRKEIQWYEDGSCPN
jgi:hypothetical protein